MMTHESCLITELFDKTLASVSSERKILAFCKSRLGYIQPRELELDLHPSKDDPKNNKEILVETVERVSSYERHAAVSTTNTTVTEPKKNVHFDTYPSITLFTRMISQNGVWPSMIRKAQSDSCKDCKLLTSYADGSFCKKTCCLWP